MQPPAVCLRWNPDHPISTSDPGQRTATGGFLVARLEPVYSFFSQVRLTIACITAWWAWWCSLVSSKLRRMVWN